LTKRQNMKALKDAYRIIQKLKTFAESSDDMRGVGQLYRIGLFLDNEYFLLKHSMEWKHKP